MRSRLPDGMLKMSAKGFLELCRTSPEFEKEYNL
jgi:hypothetical protein